MEFKEAIEKQYDECISRVNAVYSIFQNFFGEERTDLQGVKTRAEVLNILKHKVVGNIINWGNTNLTREEWKKYEASYLSELPQDELDYIFAHNNIVKLLITGPKPFILVWFPHVTVTNEHDRSTEIDNLYAKIVLEYDGTIS